MDKETGLSADTLKGTFRRTFTSTTNFTQGVPMHIHPRHGIKPISDFRKGSSQVIKQLQDKKEPILLTQRGRSVAVLLDIETFELMEEAAQLRASYQRGINDLKKGRAHSHESVKRRLRSRLTG
jgi:antitoxin YefM